MRTLDTSMWIEIYRASELGRQHLSLLSTPGDIIVPTIARKICEYAFCGKQFQVRQNAPGASQP